MRTPPWGHQLAALDFLKSVLARYRAAMLAMRMGTGKSWLGVAMANNIRDIDCVLIVCPLRVVDVWPKEFKEHGAHPHMRIVKLGDEAGSVADKQQRAEQQLAVGRIRGERVVIVINYESMWREPFATWALSEKWGLVILDESHRIKEPTGKASRFCGKLAKIAKYRLCLTGTPLPHSPLDIWSQFRFLYPDLLGHSFYAFKQIYAVMGGFLRKQVVNFRNLEHLEEIMSKITFRVDKSVLDLPPETHQTCYCLLDPDGARIYHELEREFCAQVKSGTVTAANAMVKLLRLQQVTGGNIKLDDGSIRAVDNSKADLLKDTLDDLPTDEPVVVWCRFRADLEAVHRVAKALNRKSLELSGARSELREWQEGTAPILAAQISAGGVGVDMTRACYSIYYSVGFSLGDYDQSLARIHRHKQTRPVTHIHLLSKGTVDEKIMRALATRQDLVESILNEIRSNDEAQAQPAIRAS